MDILKTFRDGYTSFHDGYFHDHEEMFRELAEKGQHPTTMIVSCVDSRVSPDTILNVDPGEIFVVRNVGNLVPPYDPDDAHYNGFGTAIEFGVEVLKIPKIVVMGHAKCGAIKGAIETEHNPKALGTVFVEKWVSIAHGAMHDPQCNCDSINSGNRVPREIEQASVLNSLKNLETYPFVKYKLDKGELSFGGWYFDIEDGQMYGFDPETGAFEPLA